MDNPKLKYLIILYYSILLGITIELLIFKVKGVQSGSFTTNSIAIGSNFFWHEWAELQCHFFRPYYYTSLFWGLSGIIGGLLIGTFLKNLTDLINYEKPNQLYPQKYSNYDLSNNQKTKIKYLIFFTLTYTILIAILYIDYQVKTNYDAIHYDLQSFLLGGLFEFIPLFISFIILSITGGFDINPFFRNLLFVLLAFAFILNLFFFIIVGNTICA